MTGATPRPPWPSLSHRRRRRRLHHPAAGAARLSSTVAAPSLPPPSPWTRPPSCPFRQHLPDSKVRGERYPAREHQTGANTHPKVPLPRQRPQLPAAKSGEKRHPPTAAKRRPPPKPAAARTTPEPTLAPAGCQRRWQTPAPRQAAPCRHQRVGTHRQNQRQAPDSCQAAPPCRRAATSRRQCQWRERIARQENRLQQQRQAQRSHQRQRPPAAKRRRRAPLTHRTAAAGRQHQPQGRPATQRQQPPTFNANGQRRPFVKQQSHGAKTDAKRRSPQEPTTDYCPRRRRASPLR